MTEHTLEFRKLLSAKEGEHSKQLDEQRAMLVLANTRLGEVDNRLRMAIEEREKAEQAATEASSILAELRSEKGKLEQRITTLSHLLEKEKNVRDGRGEEMEKLRGKLAEAVMERDQLDVARRPEVAPTSALSNLWSEDRECHSRLPSRCGEADGNLLYAFGHKTRGGFADRSGHAQTLRSDH